VGEGYEVAKEKTAAGMVWTVEAYEKVSDKLTNGTFDAGSVGANIWEKVKASPTWSKEAWDETVEWCGKAKNETVEWYGNTKEKWDKLDLTWAKWPVDKAIQIWNWGTGKVKGEPQPQVALKDDLKEIEEYRKTL
jgi:hypothetical protein